MLSLLTGISVIFFIFFKNYWIFLFLAMLNEGLGR